MRAVLSPVRVASILTAVIEIRLGQALTVKQFQRLLDGSCLQHYSVRPAVHETLTVVAQDKRVSVFLVGQAEFGSQTLFLLDGPPLELPVRGDLLFSGLEILHPRLEAFNLWVLPLRGPDT